MRFLCKILNFLGISTESKEKFQKDLRCLLVFLFCFAVFRCFIFDWYIVPSSSMAPTLLVGDMPFVQKFAYGISKHNIWFSPNLFSGRIGFQNNVKRGDVVIFKHPYDQFNPDNNDIIVIKRVIALPGDKVSVNNGVIRVNNEDAVLKYVKDIVYHDYTNSQFYTLSLYNEKLPHSECTHIAAYTKELSNAAHNYFDEITVPAGHYFVMGDNRDHSKDSRCGLGLVPEENLMGKAIMRIWSIDNGVRLFQPWLWLQNIRYSRILSHII